MKKSYLNKAFSITIIFLLFGLCVISSTGKFVDEKFIISPEKTGIINPSNSEKIIGKIAKELEIPANSGYFIKFNSNDFTFTGKDIDAYSSGLSDKIKDSIAKSPRWIQRELTRQFKEIDGEEYADLILEMSKKYVDEIAFSIAFSPVGNVPSVDLIRENALYLYENDEFLKYSDIIDFDDGQGNYYSTIKYWVIEDDVVKQLEYPPEIYYWNVVHPGLISKAEYVYGKFWREYLFNHNDLGYPLLKEKLSEINYLWDCKSYSQPGHRLWSWSMENHPTTIEAVSYWVGKTVPEQAYGDRPGQPNIIAHEHNGWCGELKIVAVAALSAALVPSVSVNNIGEDHVWREFYERGWHQNDNWWADGGGAVNNPDIYAYGWGKDMSSIYAKKGDSSIYEVTSTYIHPEDRVKVSFQVLDRNGHPVDGARIIVTVEGPKDITWLKYLLLEGVENIWNSIPPILRGLILEFLYNKAKDRIESIPDIVDGSVNTVWNYTDMNGKCSFDLGKNREYEFIIQYGNLDGPLSITLHNKKRVLKTPEDKEYEIVFPLIPPIKYKHTQEDIPNGDLDFKVSFDTKSYQVQGDLSANKKGIYEKDGRLDFFILDEENFQKYKNSKSYTCYNFFTGSESDIEINAQENNYYFVFRNNGRKSNVILNFSITVDAPTTDDSVRIFSPDTDIFDNPVYNLGDNIGISGIATDDIILTIEGESSGVTVENYHWTFEWDTSGFEPGDYTILVDCGDAEDEILVNLIDVIPPDLEIDTPIDGEIVETVLLTVEGHSFDNLGVDYVEVSIDRGEWRKATGTEMWSIDWDISSIVIGEHIITARAFDKVGTVSYDEITFALNESGHSWGPQINNLYHQPVSITNVSNVIIFANVTSNSPFSVQKVVLFLDNGTGQISKKMFRYADNPVQERHVEDPLNNMSNDPIYGLELGQFSTGSIIEYWIETYDYVENKMVSSIQSFIIES